MLSTAEVITQKYLALGASSPTSIAVCALALIGDSIALWKQSADYGGEGVLYFRLTQSHDVSQRGNFLYFIRYLSRHASSSFATSQLGLWVILWVIRWPRRSAS